LIISISLNFEIDLSQFKINGLFDCPALSVFEKFFKTKKANQMIYLFINNIYILN